MKEKIVDNLAEELKVKDKLELGKERAEGLLPITNSWKGSSGEPFYWATDIYKLLGEGAEYQFGYEAKFGVGNNVSTDKIPTHKGFLIGIRPITPQSEERQIIQSFVNCLSHPDGMQNISDAIVRAKEWLAKEKS